MKENKTIFIILLFVFLLVFINDEINCEIIDEFNVSEYKQQITDNILKIGCIRDEYQAKEISILIFKSVYKNNFNEKVLLDVVYDNKMELWKVKTCEENVKYLLLKKSNCQVVGIGEGIDNIDNLEIEKDIIDNENIALKISELILKFIYGDDVTNDLPLIIESFDEIEGIWLIKTDLPNGNVGGNGYIALKKHNCEVVNIWLTQ